MSHDGFQVEPIELSNGWSGRVLIGSIPPSGREVVSRSLPSVAQWRPALSRLVSHREGLPHYAVLKYSDGGEVFRAQLTLGDQSIDIIGKQSLVRGVRQRVARAFGWSRERRNFDRALTLLKAGIHTALPLAWVESTVAGASGRTAWMITEFLPDRVDLDQVALRLLPRTAPAEGLRVKKAMIDVVVDLLDSLQRHHLGHGDLKASNILLKHWDSLEEPVSLWLVDLDGLYHRTRWRRHAQGKALMRLTASLLRYSTVTRTDFARFLRRYVVRTGRSQPSWKQLYRTLAFQADRYARQSKRRKTHKIDSYSGEP